MERQGTTGHGECYDKEGKLVEQTEEASKTVASAKAITRVSSEVIWELTSRSDGGDVPFLRAANAGTRR